VQSAIRVCGGANALTAFRLLDEHQQGHSCKKYYQPAVTKGSAGSPMVTSGKTWKVDIEMIIRVYCVLFVLWS